MLLRLIVISAKWWFGRLQAHLSTHQIISDVFSNMQLSMSVQGNAQEQLFYVWHLLLFYFLNHQQKPLLHSDFEQYESE